MKKYLGFVIRLTITIALILYIVKYLVVFEDKIFLKTNQILSGEIIQIVEQQYSLKTEEIIRLIPQNEVKKVELGFFTLSGQLDLFLYLLFSLFLVCNILLNSWRLKLLLFCQSINVSYLKIAKISFISAFFGNFLPGFTGGDLVKIYYIAKEKTAIFTATMIVFFDRAIGLTGLVWVASLMAFYHIDNAAIAKIAPFIFILFAGSILGLSCLFFFPFGFLQNKNKLLDKLIAITLIYRDKPYIVMQSLLISLVIQCCTNTAVYGFAKALGVDVPFYVFFVYVPIGYLVMMLPISLAGWGIGEATYSYLFSNVGVTKTKSVAISVLLKLSQMLASMWGGILWMSSAKEIKELSVDKDVLK